MSRDFDYFAIRTKANEQGERDALPFDAALWLHVVGQAFLDAFVLSDGQLERHAEGRDGFAAAAMRREALKFLLSREGSWARSREMVCQAAHLNAEVIRTVALRRWRERRDRRRAEAAAAPVASPAQAEVGPLAMAA